jgi:hypothetical protein
MAVSACRVALPCVMRLRTVARRRVVAHQALVGRLPKWLQGHRLFRMPHCHRHLGIF